MNPKVDGRAARHAHRRPELVNACADYVLAHGVQDLSLRPLAEYVGISHRTLLHHFGSKEQLFVEVLAELRGRERLYMAATAADVADDRAAVGDVLTAVWRRMSAEDHLPFLRLLFELIGLAVQRPEAFDGFLQSLIDDWTGGIRVLLEARDVPSEDASRLATFVYDAVRGLLLDLVSSGERARVDAGFEELVWFVNARLAALTEEVM